MNHEEKGEAPLSVRFDSVQSSKAAGSADRKFIKIAYEDRSVVLSVEVTQTLSQILSRLHKKWKMASFLDETRHEFSLADGTPLQMSSTVGAAQADKLVLTCTSQHDSTSPSKLKKSKVSPLKIMSLGLNRRKSPKKNKKTKKTQVHSVPGGNPKHSSRTYLRMHCWDGQSHILGVQRTDRLIDLIPAIRKKRKFLKGKIDKDSIKMAYMNGKEIPWETTVGQTQTDDLRLLLADGLNYVSPEASQKISNLIAKLDVITRENEFKALIISSLQSTLDAVDEEAEEIEDAEEVNKVSKEDSLTAFKTNLSKELARLTKVKTLYQKIVDDRSSSDGEEIEALKLKQMGHERDNYQERYMLVHDILDEITKKFDVVSSQREHVQEEIKKSGAQCRKVGADLSLALSGAERFKQEALAYEREIGPRETELAEARSAVERKRLKLLQLTDKLGTDGNKLISGLEEAADDALQAEFAKHQDVLLESTKHLLGDNANSEHDSALFEARLHSLVKEFTEYRETMEGQVAELKEMLIESQSEMGLLKGTSRKREELISRAQKALLANKPWVGIELAPDCIRPKVRGVRESSAAAGGNVRVGDVIEFVDGLRSRARKDFLASVKRMKSGQTVVFQVLRGFRNVATLKLEVASRTLGFTDSVRLRRIAEGVVEMGDEAFVDSIPKLKEARIADLGDLVWRDRSEPSSRRHSVSSTEGNSRAGSRRNSRPDVSASTPGSSSKLHSKPQAKAQNADFPLPSTSGDFRPRSASSLKTKSNVKPAKLKPAPSASSSSPSPDPPSSEPPSSLIDYSTAEVVLSLSSTSKSKPSVTPPPRSRATTFTKELSPESAIHRFLAKKEAASEQPDEAAEPSTKPSPTSASSNKLDNVASKSTRSSNNSTAVPSSSAKQRKTNSNESVSKAGQDSAGRRKKC